MLLTTHTGFLYLYKLHFCLQAVILNIFISTGFDIAYIYVTGHARCKVLSHAHSELQPLYPWFRQSLVSCEIQEGCLFGSEAARGRQRRKGIREIVYRIGHSESKEVRYSY